jgi:aconitate hydratase
MDRPMLARYADVYKGDKHWQAINVTGSETYSWRPVRPMSPTRPTSKA